MDDPRPAPPAPHIDVDRATGEVRISTGGQTVVARRGDLVVSYRRSPYQRVSDVTGDPCTHAAILDVVAGRALTLEMGPKGVFRRRLTDFVRRYEWIAIVHLQATDAQRATAVAAARRHRRTGDLRYSHAQCVLIGTYAMFRRMSPARAERPLTWLAMAAARVAHWRHRGRRATCSGYVASCYADAGLLPTMAFPSRPRPARRFERVALADLMLDPRHRRDPGERRGALTILVSPSDLAVTLAHTHTSLVRPGRVEVLSRRSAHAPGTSVGQNAEVGR